MSVNDKLEAFADRLANYWKAASVAMSQGGNHTMAVDPTFMDDLRACEAIVRIELWTQKKHALEAEREKRA
jgi:hypothetical protein